MLKIKQFMAEFKWELLFFTSIFVMLFAGIMKYPFLDVDTYQWMEKSFEIYRNNNWLTYTPWFGKPPLIIWITALSFKLFGISLFSMRVMHQIMSFLLILFVYLLGKEIYGRKIGMWSAVIFAASPMFLFLVFSYKTDIPLAMFMTAAFFCFYRFRKTGHPINIYLVYILCTSGFMMKSIYAYYPIVLIPLVAWITRDKKIFKMIRATIWHNLAAILICVLAVAPWIIGQYMTYGKEFLGKLGVEIIGRLLYKGYSVGIRDTEYIAYSRDTILFFLPWTMFIVPMFISAWKKAGKSFDQLLLMLWFFVPLAVFTFSGDLKVIRYLTFAFPALAILFAVYFNDMKATFRLKSWVVTASVIFSAAFIGLIMAAQRSTDPFARDLVAFMGPFLLSFSAILLIFAAIYAFKPRESLVVLAIGTMVSLALLLALSFVHLDKFYQSNIVCAEVSSNIPEGRQVIVYDMNFNEYQCLSRPWIPLKEYGNANIRRGDIIMSSEGLQTVSDAVKKSLKLIYSKDSRNKSGRDIYRYRLYRVL